MKTYHWTDIILSQDGPKDPLTRIVLLAISKIMNGKYEECYPSYETIAVRAGVGKNTVIRRIEKAEQDGWLTVERRFHRPNIYRARLPEGMSIKDTQAEGTQTDDEGTQTSIKDTQSIIQDTQTGIKDTHAGYSGYPSCGLLTPISNSYKKHIEETHEGNSRADQPPLTPSKIDQPNHPTALPKEPAISGTSEGEPTGSSATSDSLDLAEANKIALAFFESNKWYPPYYDTNIPYDIYPRWKSGDYVPTAKQLHSLAEVIKKRKALIK